MNLLKVSDHNDLYRDSTTGAIINNNSSAYEAYVIRKRQEEAKMLEEKKRIQEFEDMKKDVNEIKQMLLQLLEKR